MVTTVVAKSEGLLKTEVFNDPKNLVDEAV
jgi:hypothetical protein